MIIKTGIDVIEVSRIQECIIKFETAFLNRIFSDKEISYCESRNVQKYQSYAGRFAAKEAIFKAFSDFIENKFDIEWKDIEIINNESGRPCVTLNGNFKNQLHDKIDLSNIDIDISISHINELAIANAVVKMEVQ